MQRSAPLSVLPVQPTSVAPLGRASSPACPPTLLPLEAANSPTSPPQPKPQKQSRSRKKGQQQPLRARPPSSRRLFRRSIASEAPLSVQESIGTRWRTKMAVSSARWSNLATDPSTRFPPPTMAREALPMMAHPSPRRTASRMSVTTAERWLDPLPSIPMTVPDQLLASRLQHGVH